MDKRTLLSVFFLSAVAAVILPWALSAEDRVAYTADQKDLVLTVKDLLATLPADIKPSAGEVRLYDLIMEYRKTKGLPVIPYSKSLSKVAKIHVRDLQASPPSGRCNMHSWSGGGPWSAGCYTPDHALAKIMWDKPRELTRYAGDGFEIAAAYSARMTADVALSCWQGSQPHNNVILNRGMWDDVEWKAIGIGICGNYSVVWFGKETDPQAND